MSFSCSCCSIACQRSSRSGKDMLLAVGDRYEADIAAPKAADAKYR